MNKDKENNQELIGLGEKLSNERLSKGKKGLTNKVLLLLGLLVLGGVLFTVFTANSSTGKYEFVKATKRDIRESVEITGNVEAGATINLNFRDSGQVEEINFEAGNKVKKDEVIASLKNRDQELRLEQARANLSGAQANLNQKIAGSTDQEIRIADASVLQAQAAADKVSIDWNNAKVQLDLLKKKYQQNEKTAQLMVDDAKAKYDYALKNAQNTDLTSDQALITAQKDLEAQLYTTGNAIQQSLVDLRSVLNVGSSVLGDDLKRLDTKYTDIAYSLYDEVFAEFPAIYDQLKSGTDYQTEVLEGYAVKEQEFVTKTLQAQKALIDALTYMIPSSTSVRKTAEEWQTKISNDSSALSASYSALNLKYQAILTAQLNTTSSGDTTDSAVLSAKNYYEQQLQSLEKTKIDHQVDLNTQEASIRSLQAQYQIQLAEIESSKASLDLKKVGPRSVDLAYLRAQVSVNQIAVALAEEALEKTLLRAPMAGVLSRSNIEVGEDVLASNSVNGGGVFEMISDQKFKIEAEIAEVDINKLKVGDKAEVTLDAVGDNTIFPGTITKIDPVETVIQDVVFYKAEIVIDSVDSRIKPGMTATVNIVLKEAKDAVSVPEKAVQTDNGKRYVRVLVGKNVLNIDVETGLRDLQGNIEIIKGLNEGQEIILRTINGK